MAKQGLAELTPDLLILKVSILEEQFKKLEKLISTKLFQLDSQLQTQIGPIAPNNQSDCGLGAPQVSLLKELELFNLETVDEKVRMLERLKVIEEQNNQMQKDLETLIFRIEELEVENSQLKQRQVSDKVHMDQSFSHRVDQELRKMEFEAIRKIISDLAPLFELGD